MNYKILHKERPPRYEDASRPPCDNGHKQWKVMLITLILAAILFPTKIFAADLFHQNQYSVVTHNPTVTEPYTVICVLLYDPNGNDTYWSHANGGPVLSVLPNGIAGGGNQYTELCQPDWELAWTSESAIKAEISANQWWGSTYTKNINGVNYTVRFWDPHKKDDGMYYVSIVIDQDKFQLGHKDNYRIVGTWHYPEGDGNMYRYWDPDVIVDPNPVKNDNLPFGLERTGYGKMKFFGKPIDWGCSGGIYSYTADWEGGGNALTANTAADSFSFTEITCPEGDNYGEVLNYNVKQCCTVPAYKISISSSYQDHPETKIYSQNDFTVSVEDYVRAKNITGNFDKWKKQMSLSWEEETLAKGNPRVKPGTWSVYVSPNNDPSQKKLATSNIPAGTLKSTVDADDYFNDYTYDVVFVPHNGPRLERLSVSTDLNTDASFAIQVESVTGRENSIELKWQTEPYKGSLPFTYNIFRTNTVDNQWEQIGTKSLNNQNDVKFSFVDSQDLSACNGYRYLIQASLFDGYIAKSDTTEVVQLDGNSKVTAITTTKGDYQGMVKVTWDAVQIGAQPTQYELMRRVKGTSTWATLHREKGTNTIYSYEDNTALPGVYYEYRVVSKTDCGSSITEIYKDDIGFARSTGIVSGRITYGTGTAVKDARVSLVKNSENMGDAAQFYSVCAREAGDGLFLDLDGQTLNEKFNGKDFSVQMFVRPNDVQNGASPVFFDLGGNLSLRLGENTDNGYKLLLTQGEKTDNTGIILAPNEFTSLTLSVSKDLKAQITAINKTDSVSISKEITLSSINFDANTESGICIGGSYTYNGDNAFCGYVDEMRIFSDKALTQEDILKNYNHLLAGTEDGLIAYWPVDEGISDQTAAYDYSKTSGVANGNHARFGVMTTTTSEVLPTSGQLSLFAYTDTQGNYTIRGVPFSGEGTNYMVVPTMGIHEFSPQYSARYIGSSSLVHSGVDFEDVSSFPVSGHVFYAGTNYPVEGVQFAVDGTVCSKDSQLITSDAQGNFTISVPIGDHYITASLNGHDFDNAGRYPADPNGVGTRITFDREIKNLEFTDATLVNFTGKVVGGDIESNKAVGFGLSKNNIGKAELVLTPTDTRYDLNVVRKVNGAVVSYEINDQEVAVESATTAIKSVSRRGATADHAKKIIIRTDSLTGEYSAMVPPLMYNVSAPRVIATDETVGSATTINLTKTTQETSDTLYNKAGEVDRLYTYNVKHNVTHHSKPEFIVAQTSNSEGAFGIKEHTGINDLNQEFIVGDIYTTGDDGKPVYTYGAPIFEEMETYVFDIKASEKYVNRDDATNSITDIVPLSGLEVTISNGLSSEQKIFAINNPQGGDPGTLYDMTENTLKLDDNGSATYVWKAGLPNITAPYKRTISMSYDIADRTYMWDPGSNGSNMLEGIILGCLPTGNNFVTSGPTLLNMILRDPPGTASSASWTKGSITSKSKSTIETLSSDNYASMTLHLGYNAKFGSGLGFIVISETEAKSNTEFGVNFTFNTQNAKSWTSTITAEKEISTSSEPEYVGDKGDLFIGTANNLVYGLARKVGFYPDGSGYKLDVQDTYTTGLQFETEFAYTANYIENVLIPNLINLRNSKLTYVTDINSYTPKADEIVYLTTLKPEDKGYGTSNNDVIWGSNRRFSSTGKSYTMKRGPQAPSCSDEIIWYNNQINTWINKLWYNEYQKVEAYNHRADGTKNYSFEAGSSITATTTNENCKSQSYETEFATIAHLGEETGFNILGAGFTARISTETGLGTITSGETSETEYSTFRYTLAETGDDDALTVDVYDVNYYSPVFRTRGGQTSGPYEGEVKTKYYHPGTTIMEATMQIEVPKIAVDVATVTDVPAGQPANYTLRMTNESQTNEDVYYRLMMIDETNPDGAKLTIDGQPLTDGRIIKISAGETVTKALQLTQTNLGVLDYDNIGIVLASQSQYDPTSTWEQIADSVYVTAHFAPSSSTVNMNLSRTTLNSSVGDKVTVSFNNFDRNYLNLKAFRIQYKRQGDTDWNLLHEYLVGTDETTSTSEPLPTEGSTVNYDLDMHNFNDGTYVFRVISVCTYGLDEVYNSSQEITLVKDMQKPTILGMPTPTNGVLTASDDISVTFNEDILKDELLETKNFLVTGVLNGTTVDHATALNLANMAQAATTEADINLSDKSFAFDLWLNAKASGTILSHGSGNAKFAAAIDESNHLVVTIGTDTYTSAEAIPMDKWAFLHLSYERTNPGGLFNATVASDDSTVNLFSDTSVAQYTGNGKLAVGQNLSASIHELCLWDEARSVEVSLLDRSKTKRPSTRHLIGYWKMNEGEGTAIRDYSRSRNMTTAAESWYINNENKAIALNGKNRVGINMTECSPLDTDDYAVELWMRADKQTGETQLLQSGETGLWLTKDGQLRLTTKDNTYEASSSMITNNAWHHVALNVMRNGNAAVYVDGARTLALNASKVGAIATDSLYIGARRSMSVEGKYAFDRQFTGQVDELRVWNATINADLLRANRKMRLTGQEPGLVAYYPFEEKTLNEYNQMITNGSDIDLVSGKHAGISTSAYTDEAPALRLKPTEQNVSFSYTASDNKIVITLKEDETTIDGCTLNFTVKNVRDVNGNTCSDICWTAFVNARQLSWSNDAISLNKLVDEPATFTVDVINNGSKQQMWEISGMPSWLTADTDNGTIDPLAQQQVTFTVAESTPIGNYSRTLYLIGNDGIEVPFTLDVNVTGEVPEWSVNPADFEQSMNLVGTLSILGQPSNDPEDIVAAFIDGECRGVAKPTYSARYDNYFVLLDIYGNESDSDKPVTFYAYDNSTGIKYPELVASQAVNFGDNRVFGTFAEPIALNATGLIEQTRELSQGWNWVSFYVHADEMNVEQVFSPVATTADLVKNQTVFGTFENGQFFGTSFDVDNQSMYKLHMTAPQALNFVGNRLTAEQRRITIQPGWNWIAYNSMQTSSVADALAGIDPQNGDVIKGQRGFAMYDGYEWNGSLNALMPGQGYMLQSATAGNRTLDYPTLSTTSTYGASKKGESSAEVTEFASGVFTPIDYHRFPGNMCIVAAITWEDEPAIGYEVGVFDDTDCRNVQISNDEGLAYFTVPGEEKQTLRFKIVRDGQIYVSTVTVNYEEDAIIGSHSSPFVVPFSMSGIEDINAAADCSTQWYTVSGLCLPAKPEAPGVYILRTFDKRTQTVTNRKVIIEK